MRAEGRDTPKRKNMKSSSSNDADLSFSSSSSSASSFSSSNSLTSSATKTQAQLPDWIFDVDDEDEIDGSSSLLEELEIDLEHIYSNIIWSLLGPLQFILAGLRRKSHKSSISNSETGKGSEEGLLAHGMDVSDKGHSNLMSSGEGSSLGSFAQIATYGRCLTAFVSSIIGVVTNNMHPLHSSHCQQRNIDFWGPCSIVSLYGALLWLCRVKQVPWIYVIWAGAAVFNHLVCRVWLTHPKLMLHLAVLGYSVTPIIPIATLISLLATPVWLAALLEILAVSWSSFAAILAYRMIASNVPQEERKRFTLLVPTVVLMELYLISLFPIRDR